MLNDDEHGSTFKPSCFIQPVLSHQACYKIGHIKFIVSPLYSSTVLRQNSFVAKQLNHYGNIYMIAAEKPSS